jgi:hypothetical protein
MSPRMFLMCSVVISAMATSLPAAAQPSERPPESSRATELSAFVGGVVSSYTHVVAGGVADWELNRWSSIEARGSWFVPQNGSSGFSADLGALVNVIPRQRVTPYVGASFGLYLATFDSGTTQLPRFYQDRDGGPADLTFTDPALRLTAGVDIVSSRRLTVRPEASSLLVWRDGRSETMVTVGVRVGYRFEEETVAGAGGSSHGHSSTCRIVITASASSAIDKAKSSPFNEDAEKSTAQSTCLNGGEVSPARGGTVRTGQVAFRSTLSVTDPSRRCSKPLWPCVPITMRSAGRLAAQSRCPARAARR